MRTASARARFVASALTLAVAGCATGVVAGPGVDTLDADATATLDGSTDDAGPPDVARAVDARTDTAPRASCVCGTSGCGACPTVATIAGAGFRIDSIEVTNAAYAAFVATNPTTQGLPPACAANAFTPSSGWPAVGKDQHPVTSVDWCDAVGYCRWAGKRLCGAIGGGAVPYGELANATRSAWFAACSAGGTRAFPYGASYLPAACNGADRGKAAPITAGESPDCVGGTPGLFDMSGNVWEWEDACVGAGADDDCRIRGGSFANPSVSLACAADGALPRSTAAPNVGFRCCSP